jgi:L-amino acid N-acyltransferase YncA
VISILTSAQAERAFHELSPGGRLECTPQNDGYREVLLVAGFIEIDAQDGIVRATKPPAPEGVTVRPMRASDAEHVLAIYQAGIDGGRSSFETKAPTWEEFDRAKLPLHRHVAVDTGSGEVLGWVAAIPTSSRCAYAGVVEHSVYVDPRRSGRGIGTALFRALIGSTEAAGIWTVQPGVFPENTASLHLHERAGFRVVGTRTRVGRHHGRWRDVVLIERRSTIAGAD